MSQELYDSERELIANLAAQIRAAAAASQFDHRRFVPAEWLAGKPIHADEKEVSQGRLIYALASILKPKQVLEIGIGPGITAHSLMSAAQDQNRALWYHGIDNMGSDFHVKAVQATFESLWARRSGLRQISMEKADSDSLAAFTHPGGPIDLIHVDGDHSFDHQYRDVYKAIASGAEWLLVDDCNDTEVATATFAAWKDQWNKAWRGGLMPMVYFEHSRTGSYLFHLGMWKGH